MWNQSVLGLVLSFVSASFASCPNIIAPKDWGASTPIQIEYSMRPVEYAIIHHTASGSCSTQESCSSLLVNIQNYHIDTLEFDDIGYNFMIGGDGQIYEGVGWHKVGAHLYGYNSRSIGIAFIGTFTDSLPPARALQAAKDLLKCGLEQGELSEDYKLVGARQLMATEDPGRRLYRDIQSWPHYTRHP